MASEEDLAWKNNLLIPGSVPGIVNPREIMHPAYRALLARMRSFATWRHEDIVPIDELCKNGFYRGKERNVEDDTATCYWCGVEIHKWEPGNDPYITHKEFSPDCGHIKLLSKPFRDSEMSEDSDDSSDPLPENESDITGDFMSGQTEEQKSVDEDLDAIKQENEMLREKLTCTVCLEADKETVLLPCCHWATCVQCSVAVTSCPICSKELEGIIRTSTE